MGVVVGFLMVFVAFLYAAVGHGGASAYLAIMALTDLDIKIVKPAALMLNILVSGVACIQFCRAGFFRTSMFWPLVATSIPMAYLGGTIQLDPGTYKKILGMLLLIPSIGFLAKKPRNPVHKIPSIPTPGKQFHRMVEKCWGGIPFLTHKPPLLFFKGIFRGGWRYSHWKIGSMGLVIGFVSGVLAIGGGVLLSPLLLFFGWTNQKQTAALGAGFILVNSLAGLAGQWVNAMGDSGRMEVFQVALNWVSIFGIGVFLGGWAGSFFGARRFEELRIRSILGLVLLIAAIKLILT